MLDGARRNHNVMGQLPDGAGDLTLVELQEMASRQQQMVETQQQVLVAKEQRLKYLRQQESRHAQLASESERLRKIRERVENQELKLKKLRALRDQAELFKINNGQLNSELEAVKTVFSEKEKELALAVARVDHLTRQLKDLKNGVISGMPSNKQTASNSELEKLRKELLMRNKLNEQQGNMIATKEKLLNDHREKVALMDAKIHKLQQRLKKRQLQEQQVGIQGNKVTKFSNQHTTNSNVITTEPVIQYVSQDIKNNLYTKTGGYNKQDPKYHMPSDAKFSNLEEFTENPSTKQQDVNISDLVEEYKLPVVLSMNNASNLNDNALRQNSSYSQRPPPPERTTRPVPGKTNAFIQNTNISKPGPVQNLVNKPSSAGTKFFPGIISGGGHLQRSHVSLTGSGDGPSRDVVFDDSDVSQSSSSALPPSGTSSHPIISISDEERQAGSGQSSPASSESSPNSSSGTQMKTEPVNTSSIGPVSAMIEKLNKNVKGLDGQTQQTSSTVTTGLRRLQFTQRPHGPSLEANGTSQTTGRSLNGVPSGTNRPVGTHLNTQGLTINLPPSMPQDELGTSQPGNNSPHTQSSITSSGSSSSASITNQASISGPHLNQKPALTYRYASKNTIANTYMGRLGSAAMEKYQQNLNLLYKNVDSQGSKNVTSAEAGTTSVTAEGTTSFTHPPSADTLPPSHPQFGAAISSPSYPDIASDKGSFKLHTPKQVRRRHSDSENEDLNKALKEQQEKDQQQQQAENEVPQDTKLVSEAEPVSPSTNKTTLSVDKNKNITNTQQLPADIKPPESQSSTSTIVQKNDKVLSPPAVTKSASSSKVEAVLRRTKSNLKKDGSRKSNNRVSFDPLALLLDASLEGELDLVRKVAVQVDDVSAANDEGITALHNAICAGHYDIVTVLVEFGCDVNSPDSDGWTPLHCAASCNNLPMVRFLVEHGACVFATTISDHETAADKCEEDEEGYDSCSDYLYSIQEKLGITNNGEVYAVFDYQATKTDELSFRSGDKLTILRKGDENEKEWWWAQLTGKEGYIPRNLLGLYPRVTPGSKEVSDC